MDSHARGIMHQVARVAASRSHTGDDMRKTSYTALLAALMLAPATIAWTTPADTLTLQPDSKLWVSGTSNVRDFECAASSVTVAVTSAPGAVALIASGEKAVTGVGVRVPATQL